MKIFRKIISLILTVAIMISMVCVGTVNAGAEGWTKSSYSITGKYDGEWYAITLDGIGSEEYSCEVLALILGYTHTESWMFATDDGIYQIYITTSNSKGTTASLWLDKWDAAAGKNSGKLEQVTNIAMSVSDVVDETGNYLERTVKINTYGNGGVFIEALRTAPSDSASVFINRGYYDSKIGGTVSYDGITERTATPKLNFSETSSSASKKNISALNISVGEKYGYTGKNVKASVTVKDGSKTLKKGTDYTLTYKNCKEVGTASVTIKGKGNYTGSKTLTYKIVPKKTTLKAAKKSDSKVKLSWTAVKGAEKYQIYYSTDGKTYKKLATASGSKTSVTLSGLDFKKNDYKFKIRSYGTNDGKKYYSSFSKVVTVK